MPYRWRWPVGIAARVRPGHCAVRANLRKDRRPQLLGLCPRHHDHRGGAIGDLRRRTGCHGAVRGERRTQFRQCCRRGVGAYALVIGDHHWITPALRHLHRDDLVVEQAVLLRFSGPTMRPGGVSVLILPADTAQQVARVSVAAPMPSWSNAQYSASCTQWRPRSRRCRTGTRPAPWAAGMDLASWTPSRRPRLRRTRRSRSAGRPSRSRSARKGKLCSPLTAGTVMGIPALTAACRAVICPAPAWASVAHDHVVDLVSADSGPLNAALMANPPRSIAEKFFRDPASFPIGVLAPPTMTDPGICVSLLHLFFLGRYRSVIVPSNASAAMPMVSERVGCGWMVRPMSAASAPISIASAASV